MPSFIKKSLLIGLFVSIVIGAGFLIWKSYSTKLPINTVATEQAWQRRADGLERFDKTFATPVPATRVIIYRLDPTRYKFRFADAGTPRLLKEWRRGESATLVVNGVYFHEDYTPSGSLIINGEPVGARSFDADKSGLINFDQGAELIDTKTNTQATSGLQNAAQTYPFLIKNGKEAIQQESNLSARRTFIGSDTKGNIYLGIIPESAITLYQLSRLLQTVGVSWDSVLNLDGGPSTGLSAKFDQGEETFESFTGVPNVIVVEPKTNAP